MRFSNTFRYSGGEKGVDIKEYKKHHQMLVMNLRQPHNEALVCDADGVCCLVYGVWVLVWLVKYSVWRM
ncbi:hypothetical protein EON65_16235 [archaeon]|nr:MAG: hypothetical protein EON65_16235 [archaeon]